MNAVLCDGKGIPFSADRFLIEPQSAHEFLEIMESCSVNYLPKWREMTEDLVIQEAQYRLHCMARDLEASHEINIMGRLQ